MNQVPPKCLSVYRSSVPQTQKCEFTRQKCEFTTTIWFSGSGIEVPPSSAGLTTCQAEPLFFTQTTWIRPASIRDHVLERLCNPSQPWRTEAISDDGPERSRCLAVMATNRRPGSRPSREHGISLRLVCDEIFTWYIG